MYAWLRGRESVLPGCVWSGPRPEELKALNVIIRAVGEPSSNHTQITYTLTPTYNTSHPRVVCVYVCLSKKKKRGGETDWEEERKRKTRSICACSKYASCVTVKSVCADKHVVIVWVVSEWRLWICVLWRGEEGVFFLSSFFLPLSMSVLYPTPLFSIFTCSSRCEGSEILNYRNGLVSALWLYQKQPSLCSFLTWHTHFLTLW